MTKLTKNEKILRKANEKWKNFLAEGAFKKTLKEFDEDDAYHFDQDKHSEPDRTAAGNFDMGDKVKVMNRGNKYDEPEELRCRVGTVTGMDGMDLTLKFDNGEVATITYYNASKNQDLWNTPSLYKCPEEQASEARMGGESGEDWDDLLSQIMNASPDADAAEMAEKAYDLVEAGNIDGATDLIADIINNTSDPDTSETAEKAYDAVEALQMNEARMSEYGKMDAEQGLPPTKIGRGNEEYMAAYNAVLQARGEEPLDIQKPDQAYLDALRSGQLQETVRKVVAKVLTEKKNIKLKESNMEMSLQSKAKGKAMGLLQTAKAMAQAPSHEPAKGYAAAVSKAAGEIVDLMVELEGFQASRSASLEEAREIGEGDEVRIIGGALTGAEGKVIELTKTGGIGAGDSAGLPAFVVLLSKDADKRVYGAAGDEVIVQPKFVEHKFYSGDFGMELYDIDEKKNLKEALPPHLAKFFDDKGNLTPDAEERLKKAREKDPKAKIKDVTPKGYGPKNEEVIEDFEIELEGGLTFADVEEAGLVTPGVDSVIDNGDGYAQVYSEPKAMVKMAKTLEAMTGVMVSPKSHGAVDERSKDDERDLEKPVKYGSGAELEFDKKAQKFYDRKRDMYIDDKEEEDNLIKEKDEKEFAKIFARAKDMLVLSARSRVPVTLKSVQSALDVIKVPSEMEKGKLIVKNEYVIADMNELPETAKKISFTKYGMDYLSNLEGEQLDLPME